MSLVQEPTGFMRADDGPGEERSSRPFASELCDLLARELEPEAFVEKGLRALETQFRTLALSALADWDATDLTKEELFPALAALHRPSWGSWNGLLLTLAKNRRSVLRQASAAERSRLEAAIILSAILEAMETRLTAEDAESMRPLRELTRASLPKLPTLGQVLAMPITLRNRIAHDRPTDTAWWQTAAAGLRVVIEVTTRVDTLQDAAAQLDFPAPWFVCEHGERWSYNGLNTDLSAVFVSESGATCHRVDEGAEVVAAFKRLLGKSDVQENDFRRLLGKLAPEELRGVMLGDYLVGPKVGEGGFASVHVGRQLSTGRKVAVKVLRDGLDDDARARLKQEAEFLSQLNHPHVVEVINYGEDVWIAPKSFSLSDEPWYCEWADSARRKCFVALEWIEGPDLEQVYKKSVETESEDDAEQTPSIPQLTEWFVQATSGLASVHAAGLIHRDVKPSNLMLDAQGQIKVMDLGIARSQLGARSLATPTGHELGTPQYMSPEQLRSSRPDAEVGPMSDVYSLGATFYELYTRQRVFDHEMVNRETVRDSKLHGGRPVPVRTHDRSLPWELETILSIVLEPEPADRYESMESLARDLKHFQNNEPLEKRPPSLARRTRLWYRRNPALSVVATTFALVLVLVAIGSSIAAGTFRIMRNEETRLKNNAIQLKDIAVGAKSQAEDERDRARRRLGFARNVLMLFLDVYKDIPREHMKMRTVMKLLQTEKAFEASVEEYYQQIAEGNAETDPEIYRDYAIAVKGLAQLKFEAGGAEDSIETLKEAVSKLQEIATKFPEDVEIESALFHSRNVLSDAYVRQGDYDKAKKLMAGQAKQLDRDQQDGIDPELEGWDLATSLNNQAMALLSNGQMNEAEEALNEARALRMKIHEQAADEFMRGLNGLELAGVLGNLSIVYRQQKRFDDAVEVCLEAIERMSVIAPENLSDEYREQLYTIRGGVQDNLAVIYSLKGQYQNAIAMSQRALVDLKMLDSKVERFRIMMARCYQIQAGAYQAGSELKLAKDALSKCLAIYEELDAENSGTIDLLSDVAATYQMMFVYQFGDGDYEEALRLLARSDAILDKIHEVAPDTYNLENQRRTVQFGKLSLLGSLGRYEELAKLCDEVKFAPESPLHRFLVYYRLECKAALGDYVAAVFEARRMLTQREMPRDATMPRILAIASARARKDADPELTPRMRKQRSERYALEAIKLLQVNLDRGSLDSPEDLGELKHSHGFQSLRERDDFQQVIESLEKLISVQDAAQQRVTQAFAP